MMNIENEESSEIRNFTVLLRSSLVWALDSLRQVSSLPFGAVGPQLVCLLFLCFSFNMCKAEIISVSASQSSYEYLMK